MSYHYILLLCTFYIPRLAYCNQDFWIKIEQIRKDVNNLFNEKKNHGRDVLVVKNNFDMVSERNQFKLKSILNCNHLTYRLIFLIPFKALSFPIHKLFRAVFPLHKTILKSVFWNFLQCLWRCFYVVSGVRTAPCQHKLLFQNEKKSQGTRSGE